MSDTPSPRVLVTGAASGFGRAIVRQFVLRGARVLAAQMKRKAARHTSA